MRSPAPSPIDASAFQVLSEIAGEDEEDTALLRALATKAQAYVQAFHWSPPIKQMYLVFGIGGVIGLFLVRFGEPITGFEDRELWVVVGDLPSAYFVVDEARTPPAALEAYCDLMEDWATQAFSGGDTSGFFPVGVEPTQDHAAMLLSRIEHIRGEFIPIS